MPHGVFFTLPNMYGTLTAPVLSALRYLLLCQHGTHHVAPLVRKAGIVIYTVTIFRPIQLSMISLYPHC